MSFEKMIPLQKINKQDPLPSNGHANRSVPTASSRATIITPPPGIPLIQTDKPSILINQTRSTTIPLTDQIKTLPVSSTPSITSSRPISTVSYLSEYEIVDTNTQAIKKPITNIASFPPRQNASLFTSTNEKPLSTFSNTIKSEPINESYLSSINEIIKNGHSRLQSKPNNKNDQLRDLPTPTPSNDGTIRFGNTSGARTTPSM